MRVKPRPSGWLVYQISHWNSLDGAYLACKRMLISVALVKCALRAFSADKVAGAYVVGEIDSIDLLRCGRVEARLWASRTTTGLSGVHLHLRLC
jgi:hypothetical protein